MSQKNGVKNCFKLLLQMQTMVVGDTKNDEHKNGEKI